MKACPFCRHQQTDPEWVDVHGHLGPEQAVGCPECRCTGPVRKTKEEALTAWDASGSGFQDIARTGVVYPERGRP